jgi:SpoVK/Ycf46/Vps4 family AAA+-type ATPase
MISTKKVLILILNKLPSRSTIIDNDDNMSGIIWGYNYIGYIYEGTEETSKKLYLICSCNFYKYLTENNSSDDEEIIDENNITIYDRTGTYYHLDYSKRKLNIDLVSTPQQLRIIKEITKYYMDETNKSRSCVCLLYGANGSGKSTIPFLLANKINCSICKTFNPTEPGDDICTLYNTIEPTKDNPLIIMIDEIDIIINDIHYHNIKQHKSIPIKMKDKITWNGFFDDINRGEYKYTIWILTTNKPFEYFDSLDPAYMRKGRINLNCVL